MQISSLGGFKPRTCCSTYGLDPYQMHQWKLSTVVGPLRFMQMELPRIILQASPTGGQVESQRFDDREKEQTTNRVVLATFLTENPLNYQARHKPLSLELGLGILGNIFHGIQVKKEDESIKKIVKKVADHYSVEYCNELTHSIYDDL